MNNEIIELFGKSDESTKPNCKLCNSKLRKDAEKLVETGASVMAVFRFLEQKGEEISYNAVSNHVNYHFRGKQTETDLLEYSTQLQKWANLSTSDEVLLSRYIRVLDMEAMYLAAKNAKVDLNERRKNDDIILKITSQINQLKDSLREIHSDLRPVEILVKSLNRIIENKLQGTVSAETRRALEDVVNQLKKEVDDLPIEGKKQED